MSTERLKELAVVFGMTVDVLVKPNGSPIPGKQTKKILARIAKRRGGYTAIPFLLLAAL